jgi:pimeloyl-ACP methyl ester carboxylesterase
MVFFVVIASLVVALACAGVLYQSTGARRDLKRYGHLGRWIEIAHGSRLYVRLKGSGGPTVVFESGIAASSLNWSHIQERIAQSTQTVSYDRCGLGWSSASQLPRTPASVAAELHSMLKTARIEPPYILVGHSFGGLVMRRFALSYPNEVAGLVLVDPMRLEEWPPFNPSKQAMLDRGERLARIAIPIARLGIARLGVTSLLCRKDRIWERLARIGGDGAQHVMGRIAEEMGKMPREVWPIMAAYWSRPAFYAGVCRHLADVPKTVREMRFAAPIQEIPITVFTPAGVEPLTQEQIGRIGDKVEQAIAPRCAHWIHLDQPEMVIDAILRMADETRDEAAVLAGPRRGQDL